MALFPWDDWFYNVSQKEADLQALYQTYVDQKASILVHGQSYKKILEEYQNLLVKNYALLLIAQLATENEIDFKDWLQQIGDLKPPEKYDSTVFQVIQGTSELIGMFSFGKILYGAGSDIVRSLVERFGSQAATASESGGLELSGEALAGSLESISVEATETGLTEEGVEAASTIAELGSEEGGELGAEAGIEAAGEAVEEASAASLGAVATGGAVFIAVGVDAAVNKYGYLSQIRHNWENYSARHASNPSWDCFAEDQKDNAPTFLTDDQVAAFLNYAKTRIYPNQIQSQILMLLLH